MAKGPALRYCLQKAGAFLLLGPIPGEAWARWGHKEADRPDRFEKLGVEYYNDKLSYRPPLTLREKWEAERVGLWVYTGSLNQSDFLYGEHIKLRTREQDAWQMALKAERIETPHALESESESEIELSYGPQKGFWRVGLLAEGHTEKAYSDLGLSLALEGLVGFNLDLRLWAIDPFFEKKKPEADDKRDKDPWAVQLLLEQRWGDWTLQLKAEEDRPVSWMRQERGEIYEYERSAWQPRLSYRKRDTDLFVEGKLEKQVEAFRILENQRIEAVRHHSKTWEVGYAKRDGTNYSSVSAWTLQDRTRYEGVSESYPREYPGLTQRSRKEYALVGSRYRPLLDSERHKQQLSVITNQLEIREPRPRRSTEIKLQWAFDFQLSSQARFVVGTTWDIDQFAMDISRRAITWGWGGGYVHLLATF